MPVIRIDDDVWAWLQQRAVPFEDTPNDVLRRIAGLSAAGTAADGTATNDYVVRKSPDKHAHWWFQIYRRKLERKSRNGEFEVVVIGDSGSQSEKVFRVPYSYLEEHVLPKAKLESDNRYMFEVRKDTYEFIFHPGVRFSGRRFLQKRGSSSR